MDKIEKYKDELLAATEEFAEQYNLPFSDEVKTLVENAYYFGYSKALDSTEEIIKEARKSIDE